MSDRKATDILLDIESSLNNLTKILTNQNFTSSLLINKLNVLIERLSNNRDIIEPQQMISQTPYIESEQDNHKIVYPSDQPLIENSPQHIRRTSRPDVYNRDPEKSDNTQMLTRPPEKQSDVQEIVFNPTVKVESKKDSQPQSRVGGISVFQRVVDKNGKSIFLANVEFFKDNEFVHKTRTNGAGKWMASLSAGKYKVVISRMDSSRNVVEYSQNIEVDGSVSPYELNSLTIG